MNYSRESYLFTLFNNFYMCFKSRIKIINSYYFDIFIKIFIIIIRILILITCSIIVFSIVLNITLILIRFINYNEISKKYEFIMQKVNIK